jgi:hypothetical protein
MPYADLWKRPETPAQLSECPNPLSGRAISPHAGGLGLIPAGGGVGWHLVLLLSTQVQLVPARLAFPGQKIN